MNRQLVDNSPRPIDVRANKTRIESLEKIWPSARKNGIEILKKYLKGSSEVIVIDPYFYNCASNQTVDEYCNELIDVFSNFTSITSLHIIYNKRYCNQDIRTAIFKMNKCAISDIHTDEIHDRIWMKNVYSNLKVVHFSFDF